MMGRLFGIPKLMLLFVLIVACSLLIQFPSKVYANSNDSGIFVPIYPTDPNDVFVCKNAKIHSDYLWVEVSGKQSDDVNVIRFSKDGTKEKFDTNSLQRVAFDNQDTWVGTNEGAIRIRGNDRKSFAKGTKIRGFIFNEGSVWLKEVGEVPMLIKGKGIIRVRDNTERRFAENMEFIQAVGLGKDIWLLKEPSGLLRIRGNEEREFCSKYTVNQWLPESEYDEVRTKIAIIGEQKRKKWNYSISSDGNDTWVGTTEGAIRIRENDEKIFAEGKSVGGFVFHRQDVWLKGDSTSLWSASEKGAIRVHGDDEKIFARDKEVNGAVFNGKDVWLKTSNGAVRVRGDEEKVFAEGCHIYSLVAYGKDIWIGTIKGAIRIEEEKISRFAEGKLIKEIAKNGDDIWLRTNQDGIIRVRGDKIRTFNNISQWDFLQGGYLWARSSYKAYRFRGGGQDFHGKEGRDGLSLYVSDSNDVWFLYPYNGCYCLVDGKLLNFVQTAKSFGIFHGDNAAYIITDSGIFSRTDHLMMNVELVTNEKKEDVTADSPEESHRAGDYRLKCKYVPKPPYTDEQVRDCFNNKEILKQFYDIYDSNSPEVLFRAHFHYNEEIFKQITGLDALSTNNPLNVIHIPPGTHDINVWLEDNWGNFKQDTIRGFKVISPEPVNIATILAIAVPSVLVASMIIALILSPWVDLCHGLVMNPFTRRFASLGFVPVLLSLGPIRNHLLRRYRKNLEKECERKGWLSSYIVPGQAYDAKEFATRLMQNNVIFLTGESGIGKTMFLRYLTACYSQKHDRPAPSGSFAVYLELSILKELQEPLEMVLIPFERNAEITDRQMIKWYLSRGGFVLLFDGLNEVDASTRIKLLSFIRQYSMHNLVCISSQVDYKEYEEFEKLQAVYLDADKVNQIIINKLKKDDGRDMIDHLSDTQYRICRIGHYIDIMIELYKRSIPLPETESRLLSAVYELATNKWKAKGHSSFEEEVNLRSYEMLRDLQERFDIPDFDIDQQVIDDLVEYRFLVKRNEHHQFRHDLARAFLAAEYFAEDWRPLIGSSDFRMHINIKPMLIFVLQKLEDEKEIRDLVIDIILHSRRMAVDLVRWLEQNRPSMLKAWKKKFQSELGKNVLEQAT